MDTGNLFHAFEISASGLSAQRARLNVISENIANAQTTRTPDGGPYMRRLVRISAGPGGGPSSFEQMLHSGQDFTVPVHRTSSRHLQDAPTPHFLTGPGNLSFAVETDTETPTRTEYEPGHPDADPDGFVRYPNVEVIREMVDLMAASRAYEANVTVLNSTKAMLRKALEI